MAPRYRRDNSLPFQEIEGQVVVVVPARREVHQLDAVGTLLWNSLREERTVSDLVAAVCEEFDVEAERAEADVRSFLASLVERGLAFA